MKTWDEAKIQLHLELVHWFPRQCREPFERFYLYYTPSCPERDGGLLIIKGPPRNGRYVLATPEGIRSDLTIEQNYRRLLEVCRTLPILSPDS